jgi:hypothetical protein
MLSVGGKRVNALRFAIVYKWRSSLVTGMMSFPLYLPHGFHLQLSDTCGYGKKIYGMQKISCHIVNPLVFLGESREPSFNFTARLFEWL